MHLFVIFLFGLQWIAKKIDWLTWLGVPTTKEQTKCMWVRRALTHSQTRREKEKKIVTETKTRHKELPFRSFSFAHSFSHHFDDYWLFLCRWWFLLWKIYYVWTHLFVCSPFFLFSFIESIWWHVFRFFFIYLFTYIFYLRISLFLFLFYVHKQKKRICGNVVVLRRCFFQLEFCPFFELEWWMIKSSNLNVEMKKWTKIVRVYWSFGKCMSKCIHTALQLWLTIKSDRNEKNGQKTLIEMRWKICLSRRRRWNVSPGIWCCLNRTKSVR